MRSSVTVLFFCSVFHAFFAAAFLRHVDVKKNLRTTMIRLRAHTTRLLAGNTTSVDVSSSNRRFDQTARGQETSSDTPCVLEIDGIRYNITEWAKAHPGDIHVLKRFHEKDASKAFHAVGHCQSAHELLSKFAVNDQSLNTQN